MELTGGKLSNYVGQGKKDERLNLHLTSVDRDLQNLWRVINYISPLIGSAKAVLQTNASIGFSYMPVMVQVPTGTPTAYTGKAAFVFCTSNSSLYVYNTSDTDWKLVALT